jgi:hypothetical protein
MTNIEMVALDYAQKFLTKHGLKYAIQDSDGKVHGALEVQTKKKRGPLKYPMGTISNYFLPYLQQMKNDAVEIPIGRFTLDELRGSLAGWCSKNWGNGKHMTSISPDRKSIILLKI